MSTAGPIERVRAAARSLVDRLETAAALSLQSGLVWTLRPTGALTAARLLATGKSGPSAIYRIHGANSPEKPALVFDRARAAGRDPVRASGRARPLRYSYGELDELCDRVASGLRRRGLSGQSVLLMMKNRPEYMILGTGASRAGVAVVTISWRSTPAELAYLANHSGARALVFDAALAPTVEAARGELKQLTGAGDRAFFAVGGDVPGARSFSELLLERPERSDAAEDGPVVIYTSGTTGKPKGAVRKFNKEMVPSILRFLRETPFRADDVHLAACPLYHTTAFGFISMTQILGGTVVLLDEFDPLRFLEVVERERVTTTVLVPTMLHRLLQLGDEVIRRYDTRSLRAIFCTSAPLPGPDSDHAMELFGDIVFNLYGSTETGIVTLATPEDLRLSPGTIGRPVAGNDVRLLDDEGREVARGEVGELFTKNAMLVAGYHDDEASTRSSMRDGYFSVGDLARSDERGCLHLEGRKHDMVISGGVNVYPAEVEHALEASPDVDEVAVIGLPDPEWGERVTAVVVLRPHVAREGAAARLKAFCRERLAGPKVPREFVFLPSGDVLPRNPTGKVLKRELRARSIGVTASEAR